MTLMKTSSSKHYLWITAVAGVTAALGTVSAKAAFVPLPDNAPGFPGSTPLSGSTLGPDSLGGTVIASSEQNWVGTIVNPNTYQGTLRSMVVANTVGGLDFYYQVINTSLGGPDVGNDIWRIAIPGWALTDPTNPVEATFRTDGLAGLTLDGLSSGWTGTTSNKPGATSNVFSADRDPVFDSPDFFGGGAAFDFDPSQFNNLDPDGDLVTTTPQTIDAGERSNWLVLRTNYLFFNVVDSAVLSGFGSGLASTFAPIPEPSTVLFGLAMFGVCAGGRKRKSRTAA